MQEANLRQFIRDLTNRVLPRNSLDLTNLAAFVADVFTKRPFALVMKRVCDLWPYLRVKWLNVRGFRLSFVKKNIIGMVTQSEILALITY